MRGDLGERITVIARAAQQREQLAVGVAGPEFVKMNTTDIPGEQLESTSNRAGVDIGRTTIPRDSDCPMVAVIQEFASVLGSLRIRTGHLEPKFDAETLGHRSAFAQGISDLLSQQAPILASRARIQPEVDADRV